MTLVYLYLVYYTWYTIILYYYIPSGHGYYYQVYSVWYTKYTWYTGNLLGCR